VGLFYLGAHHLPPTPSDSCRFTPPHHWFHLQHVGCPFKERLMLACRHRHSPSLCSGVFFFYFSLNTQKGNFSEHTSAHTRQIQTDTLTEKDALAIQTSPLRTVTCCTTATTHN
jgi:hypothetical protein